MSRVYLIAAAAAVFIVMGLTIWGQHEHGVAAAAKAKLADAQHAAAQASADRQAAIAAAQAAEHQQQVTEATLSQAQKAREEAQQQLAQAQSAIESASKGQPVMQQPVPEAVWSAIYSH